MLRAVLMIMVILSFHLAVAAADSPARDNRQSDTANPSLVANAHVIKTFDFEEPGNFDQVPMFWNKVVGRGFPLYTTGAFDKAVFRSKATSFKLELNGGSVAYQFTPGKLPAGAGCDYYIMGFVKTTALPNARARITAWFADADGKLISSSQASSESWASADGKDDWHLLQVYLPGVNAGVHSIVLQVELLQPQQLGGAGLGQFALYAQDIHGAAWFDDISIFQLPRISISTNAAGNVFTPGQPLQLDMSLSDLGRDRLSAQLAVTDSTGATVATQKYPIDTQTGTPWHQTFKMDPKTLPQGSYTANFELRQGDAVIAQRQLHFLIAHGAPLGQPPAADFGLIAADWPPDTWPQLASITQAAGVGVLAVPAWRKEMTEQSTVQADAPLDTLITQLQHAGVTPLLGFSELPAALAQKAGGKSNSVLALADVDSAIWRSYISGFLSRYANRVSFWEIGQESDAFYSGDKRPAALYASVQAELANLLINPKPVIPWNALYDFEPKDFPNATLALRLANTIKPEQIPTYVGSFTHKQVNVLAVVDPLPDSTESTTRMADFAQRIIFAHWSKPAAVLVDMPILRQAQLNGSTFDPSELFLVYGTLAQNLGGKAPTRELSPEAGIHAYLFDNAGAGVLAVWSDSATPQAVHLALGKGPVQIDMFGHTTPLTPQDGLTTLTVSATPLLIDHIDSHLVELRASFALSTPTLPAGTGVARTSVRLENPYDDTMTGKLRLAVPPGWTMDPPVVDVQLAPHAKLDVPVTLRYPFSETAGAKQIQGKLSVDGADHPMDFTTQVNVNSGIVNMDCRAQQMPNGDLVIQQVITNASNAPLTAQAYAMIPNAARQERYILNLAPGQTVVKRFTFPNTPSQPGKSGTLGLRQTDGKILITKTVALP